MFVDGGFAAFVAEEEASEETFAAESGGVPLTARWDRVLVNAWVGHKAGTVAFVLEPMDDGS